MCTHTNAHIQVLTFPPVSFFSRRMTFVFVFAENGVCTGTEWLLLERRMFHLRSCLTPSHSQVNSTTSYRDHSRRFAAQSAPRRRRQGLRCCACRMLCLSSRVSGLGFRMCAPSRAVSFLHACTHMHACFEEGLDTVPAIKQMCTRDLCKQASTQWWMDADTRTLAHPHHVT